MKMTRRHRGAGLRAGIAAVIIVGLSSQACAETKMPADAVAAFDKIKECYSGPLEARAACFNDHSVEIFIPAQKYGTQDGKRISYIDPPPRTPPKAALWVKVIRPMISCGQSNDDDALRVRLLNLYPRWLKDRTANVENCSVMTVGEVYRVDDSQTEADQKTVLKLWSPVCPHGCVPGMTPVYAPPRGAVGPYLRPTKTPKEWQ